MNFLQHQNFLCWNNRLLSWCSPGVHSWHTVFSVYMLFLCQVIQRYDDNRQLFVICFSNSSSPTRSSSFCLNDINQAKVKKCDDDACWWQIWIPMKLTSHFHQSFQLQDQLPIFAYFVILSFLMQVNILCPPPPPAFYIKLDMNRYEHHIFKYKVYSVFLILKQSPHNSCRARG